MKPPPDPHYRHRFPSAIISHAVWLYHVFSLSLRDVELRPSRTWGSSRSAPEGPAGPPLDDSVVPLKRPVGGLGPNLQHQMSASW